VSGAEIAEGPLAGGAVLPLAELLERAGESAPLHPPVSLEIDAGLAAQPRQLRFFFGMRPSRSGTARRST